MGAIGILMAVGNLPLSPFILAYILGPMLENNLRKGLTYTDQGFLPFLTRPVSLILLLVAVGSLVWPFIREKRAEKRKLTGTQTETEKMASVFNVEED